MIARQRLEWGLRRLLHRAGVDVVSYKPTRHPIARRLKLFAQHEIDLVLDVGANTGQYVKFLRNIGYDGRILSFEPVASAFSILERECAADAKWSGQRIALGDRAGRITLNISANSECSSALPMLDRHLAAYPEAGYVAKEEVDVRTLDEVLEGLPDARIFLKVDTQGFERQVIQGASASLGRIRGVQLEMSLVPLYEGEALMPEMVNFMAERGFVIMGIEPGSSDGRTGQLLQVDGLFFRG
jgi:FkbM family methyltransferase